MMTDSKYFHSGSEGLAKVECGRKILDKIVKGIKESGFEVVYGNWTSYENIRDDNSMVPDIWIVDPETDKMFTLSEVLSLDANINIKREISKNE